MLPTKKAIENGIIKTKYGSLFVAIRSIHGNNIFDVGIDGSGYCDFYQPQHLYITIDVTETSLKFGDWVIGENGILYHLQLNSLAFYTNDFSQCTLLPMDTTKIKSKVIASTVPRLELPKPSKEFIKTYVKNNGINEIMVEFNHPHDDYIKDLAGNNVFNLTPKVAKDNTITILKVTNEQVKVTKDKLYTEEEVKKLLFKLADEIDDEYRMHTSNNILGWTLIEERNWFDKNKK